MACERHAAALSRVAAGESPGAGLLEHLEGCAPCRGHLDAARRALDAVDAALGDLSERAPGAGFSRRVLHAAEERRLASVVWLPWAAAAVVGLLALGLLARPLLAPGGPGAEGRAGGERRAGPRAADAASPAGRRVDAGDAVVAAEASGTRPPEPRAHARPAAPARAKDRSQREVRVPSGQLEALVLYARLRLVDAETGPLEGALAPLGALGTDPIRVDPLSVEPLSFDAEGAKR